jgi:hypothetical protein
MARCKPARVGIVSKYRRDVSWQALVALNLAVYIVSVGFVIELALLPAVIKEILPVGSSSSLISLHTALVTSLYPFSIFVFSGYWARLANRHSPSGIMMLGLCGFAATLLVFSQAESLPARYVERLFSGVFAAGVMPIAAGMVSSRSLNEKSRHRRLSFMSIVVIAGFFLGPLLGIAIVKLTTEFYSTTIPHHALAIRMSAVAALAILAAVAIKFTTSNRTQYAMSTPNDVRTASKKRIEIKLATLTLMGAMVIGILEIGISLLGNLHLSLDATGVSFLFAECALVMAVTQAIVFAPWLKLNTTRWLIPLALIIISVSLLSAPWLEDMSFIFFGISVSAGILSPVLSHWYSAYASTKSRKEGRQSALFSLGLAVGTLVGATIIMEHSIYSGTFLVVGLLAMGAGFISLNLPSMLLQDVKLSKI